MKSGSLNLLEPSGPVKVCNGIALPLQCLKGLMSPIFTATATDILSTHERLKLKLFKIMCARGSKPGGGEIFRIRSERPWGPPSLLYNGYRGFPGGKAAGAWRWSRTPFITEVKGRVELYLSPSGPSWTFLNIYLQHVPLQRNTTCSNFLLRNYSLLFTACVFYCGKFV
jgi:hypothetical protein